MERRLSTRTMLWGMGRRIRAIREERSKVVPAAFTLAAVARRVGVSEYTMRRWELGQARPHGRNARRLAKELGVDLGELGLEAPAEERNGHDNVDRNYQATLSSQDAIGLSASHVGQITALYEYLRNRISGGQLIDPVRAHIDFVIRYLREISLPASFRAQLVSALGQVSVLAGVLSFWDLHDEAGARHYFRLAGTAAEEAENRVLSVYALGFTSEMETYLGQSVRAIELNQAAQEVATGIVSPRVQSWLAACEAQAKAYAHEGFADVLRILDRARSEMTDAKADDPDPQWIQFFDQARLEGYEGNTLVGADQPRLAIQTLQRAADSTSSALKNYRAEIASNMAWCLLQEREIDESCRHLGTAFDLASSLNYRDGLRRVFAVRRQMDQWSEHRAVKELDEQLRSAG
jgi:transcriptional regulator with XRE-family HTH domain